MDKTEKAGLILKEFLDCKNNREAMGWDNNAIKAQNYYFNNQYDAEIRNLLKEANRADSVFNHILPAIELICGHHIQMQTDMVAKPVDRVSDPYIARFITSGLKQIEQSNDVPFEDTAQFLDGLITGVGIKDILYDTEEVVEGKVTVRQDCSFDYYLDMHFRRYDYTDATRLFRCRWLTYEQIEELFGTKIAKKLTQIANTADDFYSTNIVHHNYNEYTDYGNRGGYSEPVDPSNYPNSGYDRNKKQYRVIERFKRVSEKYEMYYEEENKQWKDAGELGEEEYELLKDTIIKRTRFKILQSTLIAHEIVIDDEETGCSDFYQRFNMFFPYFHNGRYMGAVDSLYSPQDVINHQHSSMQHILSTIGANKLLYTPEFMDANGQAEMQTNWPKTGTAVSVNALYDENGRPTYQIAQQPEVSSIYERDMAHHEQTIKEISGATSQMQGKSSYSRESGKAKQTEIQQGAVRLSPMIKNFRKTRKLGGKAYVYYMQKYYGMDRYVRIYGEKMGDTDQEITFNKQAMGIIANDITVGEYDIVIEFEGKTPSERASTYWRLIELAGAVPEYRDIIGKIVLQTTDMPEKDQILELVQQRQALMQQQQMVPEGQMSDGSRREPQRVQ